MYETRNNLVFKKVMQAKTGAKWLTASKTLIYIPKDVRFRVFK